MQQKYLDLATKTILIVNKCLEIAIDKPNMNISGWRKRGYNTSLMTTESTTLSAYNKLSHKV